MIKSIVHNGKTSLSQHFFVGNLMLLPNSENTTEASLVEGVNFLLLYSRQVPRFAAVLNRWKTQARYTVDLGLSQTFSDSRTKLLKALPIRQLI